MPNTLVHIAIQAPLSKTIWKDIGLQWVAIGCIIPDIPWIAQRILFQLPVIDRFWLRIYVAIQASLFFCLILAAILCLFSKTPKKIFFLLGFNATIHLLLDATQIKWANGVHLFGPFFWTPIRFDLFWPDHPGNYLLSLAGLFVFLFYWKKSVKKGLLLCIPQKTRLGLSLFLLFIYLIGPLFLLNLPIRDNYLHTKTLQGVSERSSKIIEFDRASYDPQDKSLRVFTGETFTLEGNLPPRKKDLSVSAKQVLSVQGQFLNPTTVDVKKYHLHGGYRDWASYLGLFLVVVLTGQSIWQNKQRACDGTSPKRTKN